MTYISAQSYVSEKGWGKATLEKSLEAQWRGNSSPRGTAGTQTRPWTEIYQDRTSTDENIYRVARCPASCLPATVNLVLFQNVNKHDCKKTISFIFWKWLCLPVCCGINDIISSGSTKQFVRGWGVGRKGEGRYSRAGWVEQGLLHERGNSAKDTELAVFIVASSHVGWIG